MSNFLCTGWHQCLFLSLPFVGKWSRHSCWKLWKVVQTGYMLIVLRYIDGGHIILWSFVQFLDFLKFLHSGNFFRFVGHHCGHIAMGFYIYLPLCQQVLDVSVSVVQQVVSKQAHGMPFCRRILSYTSIRDCLHIYWAIWLYLFQLLLYHMLLSVLWFYIH